MYAIVATGGKQYKVEVGDVIEVEKLPAEPGQPVALDVVFIADGSTITTDAQALATAKVYAEVSEHFKGEKALIFKFKKRKGYKRLRGHRQPLTKLEILSIALDGKAPKPKKVTAAKDEKAEAAEKSAKSAEAKAKKAEAAQDEALKDEAPELEVAVPEVQATEPEAAAEAETEAAEAPESEAPEADAEADEK